MLSLSKLPTHYNNPATYIFQTITCTNILNWMQHLCYVKSNKAQRIFHSSSFHDRNIVLFSSCLEKRHLVAMVSVPLLIRHLSRFAQIKIQRALNGHWRHVSNYGPRILHLPLGCLEINGRLLKGVFRSICPFFCLLLSQPALWSAPWARNSDSFSHWGCLTLNTLTMSLICDAFYVQCDTLQKKYAIELWR